MLFHSKIIITLLILFILVINFYKSTIITIRNNFSWEIPFQLQFFVAKIISNCKIRELKIKYIFKSIIIKKTISFEKIVLVAKIFVNKKLPLFFN